MKEKGSETKNPSTGIIFGAKVKMQQQKQKFMINDSIILDCGGAVVLVASQ
jgi:hypothetical protein